MISSTQFSSFVSQWVPFSTSCELVFISILLFPSSPFVLLSWKRCFFFLLYLVFRNRFHYDHLGAPVGNEIQLLGKSPEHQISIVVPWCGQLLFRKSFRLLLLHPHVETGLSDKHPFTSAFSPFVILLLSRTQRWLLSFFCPLICLIFISLPLLEFPFSRYYLNLRLWAHSRNGAALRFRMGWRSLSMYPALLASTA